MPSVANPVPTPVTPAATSGGGVSLFAGTGSSSTSGVFAALMGGMTNGLVEALDAMGARTTGTGAAPSTPTTTPPARRKGVAVVEGESEATDLAGALAMLAGGALQTRTVAPELASAATLGAEVTQRQPVATAAVNTTPAETPTAAGLPIAAAVAGVATADPAGVVGAVAEAVAMLLGTDEGVASDPTVAQGATSTSSNTIAPSSGATDAAPSTTQRSTESNLPPALAAAIARAGGAATPGALRHLSGSRVAEDAAATPAAPPVEATTVAATDGLRGKAATAVADGEVIAAATSPANPGKAVEKNGVTADPVRPERATITIGETRRVDPSLAASDPGSTTHAQRVIGGAGEGVVVPPEVSDAVAAGEAKPFVVAERREGAAEAMVATATQGLETPVASALAGATEIGRDRGVAPVAGAGEAPASTTRAVPLSDVAETIAARSHAGHSRFDIRLAPEELGGVDVRVEVRSSGEVRAHLVVERTETLDLMLRDQRQLERSLSDAGLDVGSSGLQFSLKQQPSGEGGQGWRAYDEAHGREARREGGEDETSAVAATAAVAYRNMRVGGVDLRV